MNRGLNDNIEMIAKMFIEDLKPLRQIGKELGFSGMAIQKALKRNGYDTSKEALNIKVSCDYCKKEFTKTRAVIRKSLKNFCSKNCYIIFLKVLNEGNVIDRYGMSQSRLKMGRIYGELPEKSIVHHIDGNDRNILITNLMLLASQGDHIKIHRNYGDPVILFNGEKLKEIYPNLTDSEIDIKLLK